MTLFELDAKRASGVIKTFCGDQREVERLKEFGFFKGAVVSFLGRAPFGGPQIFQVGSTFVALRQEEAECAILETSL